LKVKQIIKRKTLSGWTILKGTESMITKWDIVPGLQAERP
jgi:hypothetical protein